MASLLQRGFASLDIVCLFFRIVIVSSGAHKTGHMDFNDINFKNRPYNSLAAYCQSKLANVLHAKELAKRLSDTEISVYCVHPGEMSAVN